MRSGLSVRTTVSIGVIAFLVGLAVYMFIALPQGSETRFYGLGLDATTTQLITALGQGDGGSYTRLALDYQDGDVSAENIWIVNLWPPGVPFILWAILKLSGGALPIVPMIVLVGVLWSVAFAMVAVIALRRRAFISLGLFTIAWLVGPLTTGWITHAGVISSDGLSAGLAAIAIILLYFAAQRGDRPSSPRLMFLTYLGIGLILGVLALLRVTWLYAVVAAILALVLYLGVVALIRAARRRSSNVSTGQPTEPGRSILTKWIAVVLGFSVFVIPWTAVLGVYVHPGNLSWSNGDYQWAQLWMTDEYLNENDASFLVSGNANWACELDEKQCTELERIEFAKDTPYDGTGENTFGDFQRRAFLTAAQQPFEFLAVRSEANARAWLSTPGQPVGSMGAIWWGIVTLALFIVSCVLMVRHAILGRGEGFFLLVLAGANLGMVWLTHFETRYLMPLQIMALVVTVLAVSTQEARLVTRLLRRKDSIS